MNMIREQTDAEKNDGAEAQAALVEVVAFLLERRRKRQAEESSSDAEAIAS